MNCAVHHETRGEQMRETHSSMLRNRSISSSAVVPVLIYEDVEEAVEWLSDAFGFVELWQDSTHGAHLSVGFGDGAIVIGERRVAQALQTEDPTIFRAPRRGEVSHSTLVRVEDVDSHYARARRAGARILRQPADYAYGERQYTAEDLAGHRWTFSESIADVSPEEWGATPGPGA
jgi:uncharacterized glyoxalase superfamily protein PhnB